MVFGYIRVSTDKQTAQNQEYEIQEYCKKHSIEIESWIEETISGTKQYNKRALGKLLKKAKNGDVIICSELSRLGRNLLMIMQILAYCMEKDIKIWTIKEEYKLGDDLQSKVLAFAFGLSAEIERQLISQRTKEALMSRKAKGITLGRPLGSRSRLESSRLYPSRFKIKAMISQGQSIRSIARFYHTDSKTICRFLKKMEESGER